MASRISLSTSFSGRWSLISWCVRKPRVLPILMSVFSSCRRLATSSSVSVASSRPNSRISARSLARDTFMRSGLALALASASASVDVTSASASRSAKSSSAGISGSFFAGSGAPLAPRLPLEAGSRRRGVLAAGLAATRAGGCDGVFTSARPQGLRRATWRGRSCGRQRVCSSTGRWRTAGQRASWRSCVSLWRWLHCGRLMRAAAEHYAYARSGDPRTRRGAGWRARCRGQRCSGSHLGRSSGYQA